MIWGAAREQLAGRAVIQRGRPESFCPMVVFILQSSFFKSVCQSPGLGGVMAMTGRQLIAALSAWCALTGLAHADDGAVTQSMAGTVQLAQAEGCPAAGTTAVVFYRYVGEGEANAIKRTFAIPTTDAQGKPKDVYFTDCFYADALSAKKSLALPRKPAFRVEFKLRGVRARCPGTVEAAYSEPGGGNECILNDDSRAIEIPDPGAAITPLQ